MVHNNKVSMVNDTPTLFQVFGPPCYTKLNCILNFRGLSYAREFLPFAFFLYKITRSFLQFAQVQRTNYPILTTQTKRLHLYQLFQLVNLSTCITHHCRTQIITPVAL